MTAPVLIFDLDGTLIDSAPDIHAAAARLLKREGEPPLSFQVIRSFIGNGVPVLIDRIIEATELDPAHKDHYLAEFLEDYGAHATDLTVPYPGVVSALEAVRDQSMSLAVCTNKPEAPTLQILADLGLDRFFTAVIGGDSLPEKKPDPSGLLFLKDHLGGGPTLFIGDSEVDAQTAERAGLPFAFFTNGYCKVPVADLAIAATFDAFDELPLLVEQILQAMAQASRSA